MPANLENSALANKGLSSQSYGFSSSRIWMWELDHKESRGLKNWSFWTVVLETTLESPWDCKETQPVHRKGDQPQTLIGRTDAEAEAPILWPPFAKNWHAGEVPDAGKDRRREGRGRQRARWLGRVTGCVDLGLSRLLELVTDREERVGHDWATELNACYMTPLGWFFKRNRRT